ncbi:MAG TPA: hypothetical protein VKU19_31420 [Bryobacteraceae bacterium]|nr:hypothetical protein [Bryobacteraceae bacterium]
MKPRYQYVLSLPERAVRSLGALSGGLMREVGNVALPASVRRTILYRTMVDVGLQFLIEEVGQVEQIYPADGRLSDHFLLRRAASHGIELAGILAFHASPIWILAALADATGGSRKLIQEISQELKQEGLLEGEAPFQTLEQVLDGLEKTSGHLATSLNVPPVDIASLRGEWRRLKEELRSIPPKSLPAQDLVEGVWVDIQESARVQKRSVFLVSSLMAISAVAHVPAKALWLSRAAKSAAKRTGKVMGVVVLDHYRESLKEIAETGFIAYWAREFRPYLRGAAEQFARDHESATERWLKQAATNSR